MYHPDNWQPTADIHTLKVRATLFRLIRSYFASENVLEVDTPCLSLGSISDPHIEVLSSTTKTGGNEVTYYLQTSPEFAMKRLLCSDAPSIYQLGKVFRAEDLGRRHSIEFTMLEWYRLAFDHRRLMKDIERLFRFVFNKMAQDLSLELHSSVRSCLDSHDGFSCEKLSYRDAFLRHLNIDPFVVDIKVLQLEAHRITEYGLEESDRDTLLELLFSTAIEPHIGLTVPCFVYEYPESQAALAKKYKDQDGNAVSARFELYWRGMELANGYNELTNAAEQEFRIDQDMDERERNKQPERTVDKRLVSALHSGMPDCAGVALGVDRLLMLLLDKPHIDQVMSFAGNRA
ncbi:EF-P lysine aminoacylase EpmA [Marinomonas balearica]|uniref:Lysyl-tRNA synthetase class 2 n=1 Tax=Marinomonas balearica TaxID=491947 RepID=A0A4R6MF79_9GAMM|nr:EF-P lysine aminoacylase EpmA [Marinomonas balearica]TDP00509.1 lysyl-tRNA synthetase class 2 [Marinomonas balearica]